MPYMPMAAIILKRQQELQEIKDRKRARRRARWMKKVKARNPAHCRKYYRKVKREIKQGKRCWGCERRADENGVVLHREGCKAIVPVD